MSMSILVCQQTVEFIRKSLCVDLFATIMQAVVLAAGKGTRLRPLTEDKPKGMVEVDGKPILTHCFDQLVDLGADELVVVVG